MYNDAANNKTVKETIDMARKPSDDATTDATAEATGDDAKKEKTPRRSKFADLYPNEAKLTLLAEANPKKEGSKARVRFEHYTGSATVGDFLKKGGTYGDICYDIARKFIAVG